jgi:hypothetical protein
VIEKPVRKKFTITSDQVWEILLNIEKQGGLKEYATRTNKILEKVTEEKEW